MTKRNRVNDQITSQVVHLVTDEGMRENVAFVEAMRIATELEMDLVEVADREGQPICKILDYGKMRYEEKKRKKKGSLQVTKEIRVGFTTSEHDLGIKHKRVREFLEKKYKVRYTLELKGRQKSRIDEAKLRFEKNILDFEGEAVIGIVQMGTRGVSVLLSPV